MSYKKWVDRKRSSRLIEAEKTRDEVIREHTRAGFTYRQSAIASLFHFETKPAIAELSLEGFVFAPPKVLYERRTHTIYLNWNALGDTYKGIVRFKEDCARNPKFFQRFGGLLPFARSELFERTTPTGLKALLSGALGRYLLHRLEEKYPDSWLCNENDLGAQILKCGIRYWFEELYVPTTITIPSFVWERDSQKPELENPNGLRFWYVHTAGVHLVRPLMQFGDRAFHYLATHPVDTSNYELDRLPAYVEEAVRQLQTS